MQIYKLSCVDGVNVLKLISIPELNKQLETAGSGILQYHMESFRRKLPAEIQPGSVKIQVVAF